MITLTTQFLNTQEADQLYDALLTQVEWKQELINIYNKQIPLPRLTAWYGDKPYTYSNIKNPPKKWLPELITIKNKLPYTFNGVLLNYYRDGKDSVSWHADDEPEFGKHPTIASLSLGATRTFQMKHKITNEKKNLELTHGSLLVMEGDTQENWLHQIPKTKKPTRPRINLTFRLIQ